jgi:uncharacterized SAM-binding protein YcdF (DUF218 family)
MAGGGQVAEFDDVTAAPARPQGRRRLFAAVAGVAVVVLAAGAVLTWRWFVRPTVDGPVRADAVVVFGGAGGRLERAVALMDAGYADVIFLSDPYNEERQASRFEWFCRNDGSRPGYPVHDYETICFDPEPQTTRGEARHVADLARERGWERVDLVTSVDQATRARMLVSRCWDGEVASVVVPSDESRVLRIAYEWGAMARATFQRRSC